MKKKESEKFLQVIFNRKSVRDYTDESVSKEDLIDLLRAGMAAPSALDRRPWSFVVVTERETLDKLSKISPFSGMLKKAKAAIIVCGIPMKSLLLMKMVSLVSKVSHDYWVQDCSAATENILLAAEAKGLGAVWIGVYPVEDKIAKVREILGIPENVIPLNIISIGHPTGKERPKNKFDPKNIHWEKW
ncbi:MAG: nitroreductase family protein [Candidatus Aenigmatarchaeota archaeon]